MSHIIRIFDSTDWKAISAVVITVLLVCSSVAFVVQPAAVPEPIRAYLHAKGDADWYLR